VARATQRCGVIVSAFCWGQRPRPTPRENRVPADLARRPAMGMLRDLTTRAKLLFWLGQVGVLVLGAVFVLGILNRNKLTFASIIETTERRNISTTSPASVSEISKGDESQMFQIAIWMKRHIETPGVFDRLRDWSCHAHQPLLISFKFASFEHLYVVTVNRNSSKFIKRWQQFAAAHSPQYVLEPASLGTYGLQRDIAFDNLAATSAAIVQAKGDFSGNTLKAAARVGCKQIVRIGHKRNVAYYQAWPINGKIRQIKNAQLPCKKQEKNEIETKRAIVYPVSLTHNAIDDPYGLGFIFIMSCYCVGFSLIAFSQHWSGMCMGGISGIIATLTMLFGDFLWNWPQLIIIPITGVVIIIGGILSWRVCGDTLTTSLTALKQRYRQC
jgi:hypothetical protein